MEIKVNSFKGVTNQEAHFGLLFSASTKPLDAMLARHGLGFMSALVRLLSNSFLIPHSRFLTAAHTLLWANVWDSGRTRLRFLLEHSACPVPEAQYGGGA